MDLATYRDINGRLANLWNKCQYALDMAGIRAVVDEMSVLLTPEELSSYKGWALHEENDPGRRGTYMKWFNGTRDQMRMDTERGDGPEFEVLFEFFRPQLDASGRELPWRVEAMAVLSGHAPLHGPPMGRVVHASYKMPSEAAYEAELTKLANLNIHPVAHYRNSYGRFSYWHNDDFPWGAEDQVVLLKPRVNLRDATQK